MLTVILPLNPVPATLNAFSREAMPTGCPPNGIRFAVQVNCAPAIATGLN